MPLVTPLPPLAAPCLPHPTLFIHHNSSTAATAATAPPLSNPADHLPLPLPPPPSGPDQPPHSPASCTSDSPGDPTATVITSPDRQGISAQLALKLTWQDPSHQQPHLSADVTLGQVSLVLFPHHLPILAATHAWAQRVAALQQAAAAAQGAGALAAAAAAAAAQLGPGVTVDGWADVAAEEQQWGRWAASPGAPLLAVPPFAKRLATTDADGDGG
jgi:hypothetical protein